MSRDAILVESLLQDLVVVNKLIFVLRTPADLVEAFEAGWIDGVNDLAVDTAGCTLFDLGQIELEEFIRPLEKLGSGDKESSFHHSNGVA